jgi:hypothetical protein
MVSRELFAEAGERVQYVLQDIFFSVTQKLQLEKQFSIQQVT